MANRFWVGGTGTSDGSTTTHWSASSGGAGGASAPTASDAAFFNASSGGGVVTFSGSQDFLSINFTGFTGTFAGTPFLNLFGNITLAGKTLTAGVLIKASSTITSGGGSVAGLGDVAIVTTITLADDLILGATGLSLNVSTFDAANHNVSTGVFGQVAGCTVKMGSGTWTLTASGTVWNVSAASTVIGSSATIKLTDATSASKTFLGGSQTYGTIWCSGSGTGSFILENATFTLKDDCSGAHLTTPVVCTVSLGADLINSAANIILQQSSFNANNHAVTVSNFSAANASPNVVTMGSGTWNLTGTGTVWDATLFTTFSGAAGRINITDASAASKTFIGGGKAYGILELTGAGTGTFIVKGSNSFTSFTLDTPPHTLQFEDGTTNVATTWLFNGTAAAGNNILESVSGGTWDIVCTAGVTAMYVTLQGSHAHGGQFTADNSFDAGDNLFWIFVRSSTTAVYFDSAYTYNGVSTATLSGLNWLWGETVGVLADGVDIGDAVVSTHGNLTLPGGISASVISIGKRYTSIGQTLRSPQAGNQDGSALGRKQKISTVSPDLLNSAGLQVGSLTSTRPFPPNWRKTSEGDLYTGMTDAPIDDSSRNNGVIVFTTDRGYPCTVRAIEFGIEGVP